MRIIKARKHGNNYIWMLPVILVLTLVTMYSAKAATLSTVGLEQSTRCGSQEHVHGGQCYDSEGILSCEQPEHTHGQNCYLLLLEENDINTLLEEIDDTGDKSLEGVLTDVVGRAVTLNDRVTTAQQETLLLSTETGPVSKAETARPANKSSASVQTAQLTLQKQPAQQEITATISALNETIAQNEIQPAIVLNEKLATNNTQETENSLSGAQVVAATLAAESEQQQTLLANSPAPSVSPLASDDNSVNSGQSVMPLAVGDDPVNSGQNVNFYANIDGKWVSIGTMSYYTSDRNRIVDTAQMLHLINTSLGTSFGNSGFVLRYGSSTNNINSTASIGANTTTFGRNNTTSPIYTRLMRNNNTPLYFYTVTFVYPNGGTQSKYVPSGTAITLPTGDYTWSDGNRTYEAGDSVTVSQKATFTATELTPPTWLEINYQVNFPTVSGVSVSTRPTIAGTANTSVSDSLSEGLGTTIRNVSEQEVWGKITGHSANLSRVIRFAGWRVGESNAILKANTQLSWDELLSYASGNYLNLTAVWEYDARQTASFYIRYDSVAVDSGGNVTDQDSNLYTPELFATYVGNATNYNWSENNNRYSITDTTADNSYGADQAIRALYGERSDGVWLQSFPADDYIFELLKQHASKLSVDGVPVDVNDLNENGYAIRWYVLKSQSDAWHIDGKLVRKDGLFRVSKTFAGNKESIAAAKDGFYISAHSDADNTSTILTVEEYESYDASTDTYTWVVDGAEYGEQWTFTDYSAADRGGAETASHCYSEYIITDAIGDQSTDGAVQGNQFSVNAMTYAPDTGKDEAMEINFTNIYYKENSIILKKQDARTGTSIGGATFRLLQNGEEMRFAYDQEAACYIYDSRGPVTDLTGTAAGYYEILIDQFSYDAGNIIVREISAPEGYTPIGDVEIGYIDRGHTEIGMISESPMVSYRNGVLLIGNSTDTTSVTVEKKWSCPSTEWRDVTVQLLANGRLVTTLLPGVAPTAELTADNLYTYTWSDLPLYANGSPIVWSVRETRIGTERCKEDYTFANWVVDYSLPVYNYSSDGRIINTRFVVTNDTRRTMLRLTKTDMNGTVQLPGASFTLQLLLADGTADTTFVRRNATTGDDGTLLFDNLLYGRYELTETAPPAGYLMLPERIYLTIEESGAVTVEESVYARPGSSAFHIVVKNDAAVPLPATGGDGTDWLYVSGAMLMAAAALLYIALPIKRRCRQ